MPSEFHSCPSGRLHFTGLSQVGLLVAVCVSSGYLLAAVPNVELLTTSVFISGCLTGILKGGLVGTISMGLYSLLNPYGMAPPPLWIAQVVSYAIVGGVGGLVGRGWPGQRRPPRFLLGLYGIWFTLQYLLLTTLAYVLTIGERHAFFWATLVQGAGFWGIHLVTNTGFFVVLVPYLLDRLRKMGWDSLAPGEA